MTDEAPKQAGLVLATLIVVAAVANLPLAMANVAVAYSLGLACSVLWLEAQRLSKQERCASKVRVVFSATETTRIPCKEAQP